MPIIIYYKDNILFHHAEDFVYFCSCTMHATIYMSLVFLALVLVTDTLQASPIYTQIEGKLKNIGIKSD